MTHSGESRFQTFEQLFKSGQLGIGRGLEKEGLRCNLDGDIEQSDHPACLGHPLTHPAITTDYSEALLELITPVTSSPQELIETLGQVHANVHHCLNDQLLWAGSMPCRLNGEQSIRIAEYGGSNLGQIKHVYRQGLGVRYGRKMQSIAGMHYNFSLSEAFWQQWHHYRAPTESDLEGIALQDYISDQYFCLIRNFRRYSWLLMYLFGASPVLDQSFLSEGATGEELGLKQFDDKGTWYLPYATSLRMGDLGYHNNAQSSLNICFNKLESFSAALGRAIHTNYPPYEAIGLEKDGQFIQLNTNILQIENEYYSSIRPKRVTHSGEKPLTALTERGVEYIEVRCLDLNPFYAIGISQQQVRFLDIFLLHCLLSESPIIDDSECAELDNNFSRVVERGREPGLSLSNRGHAVSLQQWGKDLLEKMRPIAELLDGEDKSAPNLKAWQEQMDKLHQPALTPSGQVLGIMEQEGLSWLELASSLSEKHHHDYQSMGFPDELGNKFRDLADRSFMEEKKLRESDTLDFETYLKTYTAQ